MRGEPRSFWGKLRLASDGIVLAWHPLADHCADVAACCEALLRHTLIERRLAALAGQERLHPVQVARLTVLAALHDIGKFNLGFQNKSKPGAQPRAGHLAEVTALLCPQDGALLETARRLHEALRASVLGTWCDDILQLLVATISHHGRPIGLDGHGHLALWQSQGECDPMQGIADLVERTVGWFPGAWEVADAPPLPTAPAFQHAWCGLVTLADWIGSDEKRFPFAEEGAGDRMLFARGQAEQTCRRLGLVAAETRASLGAEPPGFARVSPEHPTPRAAQAAMLDLGAGDGTGSVTLLEAETGSGKTEAAFLHFARLFHAGVVDGLYFALPTRTAATQIYRRTQTAVEHLFQDPRRRPAVILAVPGYLLVDGIEGIPLPPFRVLWPDEPLHDRGWAAEHPKRYLAGTVVVGTIDQALLSALAVSHAHMRATSLLRHLLVVDEVHASDTYMTRILESVLDHHVAAGGHALLMSATLGAAARERLLARGARRSVATPPSPEAAIACAYPLITLRQGDQRRDLAVANDVARPKQVRIDLLPESESAGAVAEVALASARQGARVLVLRNTVGGCFEVQAALESLAGEGDPERLLFRCGAVPAPHHARFAKPDRERLDQAIETMYGRHRPEGGCAAVGTQTLEQSLDLDADLLITDLCPMDVLLQRIGRLHRHAGRRRPVGFDRARAIVLTPADALDLRIQPSGEARGSHGLGTVYNDLRAVEATWRALAEHAEIEIPAHNRLLVETATHPQLLDRLVQSLGEPWIRHHHHVIGRSFAHRRQGDLNLVRRDLPFATGPGEDNVLFPSGDTAHRIPTRLGLEDRLVRFDPAVPAVFAVGETVATLTLPFFMVPHGTPSDAADATSVELRANAVTFSFGGRRFLYDRLGLRPETVPARAGKLALHADQPGPSPDSRGNPLSRPGPTRA